MAINRRVSNSESYFSNRQIENFSENRGRIEGTNSWDQLIIGSGRQVVHGGNSGDHIISFADAGEVDPAQGGSRVTVEVDMSDSRDVLWGGAGGDRFEFRALLNAKSEILEQHTWSNGQIDWRGVAGENDQVHDHWVEGWGYDIIMDYDRDEGDYIVIRGHTVEVAEISYGTDNKGDYSLIRVISQQGDGGAGGINTATGAHDEDLVGLIKVYGDKVELADMKVEASGVFDGVDQLRSINRLLDYNAGSQEFESNLHGDEIRTAPNSVKTRDTVRLGEGRQFVDTRSGDDLIVSYSDDGEPNPAQLGGDGMGRITKEIARTDSNDIMRGGQGRDTFLFNFLINATDEVKAQHRRSDGTIDWRGVAGENDNPHDHWVEGVGNDTILDYSKQDGDKIVLRGHTVEIAEITYGEDNRGSYSIIWVRSQQGDGGAAGANTANGAHDEDSIGRIKVYGDKVEIENVKVEASGVFDGVDKLTQINAVRDPNPEAGAELSRETITGTRASETFELGSGRQTASGGAGWDRFIVFGDGGEPDPAQGGDRVNDEIASNLTVDRLHGGTGGDRFEFRALLNAKTDILAQHTREDGTIDWRGVAGENDNVHDHWVEGWGLGIIEDYDQSEGDSIVVRGHTVEIQSIRYGTDKNGAYSLITVISQQGDGGAGGAFTATGAHDEDHVGRIKVYGDKVEIDDIRVESSGVFDGIDQLTEANTLKPYNAGSQTFGSRESGVVKTSPDDILTRDIVHLGEGRQRVETKAGNDKIISYSDGGEPDPAQLGGDGTGRITPEVPGSESNDILSGGQGSDTFIFNFLLNATEEVKAQHTGWSGFVDWRAVAGEHDNPHDHWVEGIGMDIILDYSNQDGDKIVLRGHTVEIAEITYGEDSRGDYSMIWVRSQQGDGGAAGANTATGAHDEDSLGRIKVYGDKVEIDDIKLETSGVFDGVDKLDQAGAPPPESEMSSYYRNEDMADADDLVIGEVGIAMEEFSEFLL